MSLYNIISNSLNILENNKEEFYDKTHENELLRDFVKGLGSRTNILEVKSDKPNTIIVSCKKDTKVDEHHLKRLGLVSIARHDKESLYITFKEDVSHIVEQCNKLPNFDKAYKLSKSGDDILKALGGWVNLYYFYILDDTILATLDDMTLLDESILQEYGASDIIIFDQHKVRINMGEITKYLKTPIETAVVKDFFFTSCKYINALGGRENIGRMRHSITHINFSINDMNLVNLEDLKSLHPVRIASDDRHYILYLGQTNDVFSKVLENITAEDIEKTLVSNEVTEETKNVDISILDKKTTAKCKDSCTVYAPVTGKVVRLSSVNDEVFSKHVLGSGVAIEPTGNTLYAPFDGVISLSGTMKHALHVKSECGLTVLVHVGLNTIHSNSEYFDVLVKNHQIVKKGDPLMKFELKKLQENDIDTVVPMVVSQSNNLNMKNVKYNENVNGSEDIVFELT